MNIIIKATNLSLTDSITQYIEDTLGSLRKMAGGLGESVETRVEVGRSTYHHKKGEIFFAEVNLRIGKNLLRAKSEALTVYSAIDDVRDELRQELYKFKGKRETIFLRGARSFSKLFRMSPLARFRKRKGRDM